jgi:hypothetical protein
MSHLQFKRSGFGMRGPQESGGGLRGLLRLQIKRSLLPLATTGLALAVASPATAQYAATVPSTERLATYWLFRETPATTDVAAASAPKATTRPPGSPVLSDAEAAARVTRSSWEPRPQNTTANHRVPTGSELARFRTASDNQSPYVPRMTGNFTGTTDEIIQWAAHKWGFDEDIVRAQAMQESSWYQLRAGDGGISFGLMQVKSTIWRGTSPLSRDSTPFNVDMYGAILRQCFEGKAAWLGIGYQANNLWGCLGYYYSGNWYDAEARSYIDSVNRHLTDRAWEKPGF